MRHCFFVSNRRFAKLRGKWKDLERFRGRLRLFATSNKFCRKKCSRCRGSVPLVLANFHYQVHKNLVPRSHSLLLSPISHVIFQETWWRLFDISAFVSFSRVRNFNVVRFRRLRRIKLHAWFPYLNLCLARLVNEKKEIIFMKVLCLFSPV